MRDKYSGLALTGPKDGEFISCETGTLRFQEMPTIDFREMARVPDAPVIAKSHEFKHVHLWFATEGGEETRIGYWVPWDTKHPQRFVVETLTRAYQDRK